MGKGFDRAEKRRQKLEARKDLLSELRLDIKKFSPSRLVGEELGRVQDLILY